MPGTYYRYVNGQKIPHTVTPVLGERAAHNSDVVYSIDFEVTPHQLRHTYGSRRSSSKRAWTASRQRATAGPVCSPSFTM